MEALLDASRNHVEPGDYPLIPGFGGLQVEHHDSDRWAALARLCSETPCTLFGYPLTSQHISAGHAALLNRVSPVHQLHISKTPDSLVFTIVDGDEHYVTALLHDHNMYVPPQLANEAVPSIVVAVRGPPRIRLVSSHGVTDPEYLSRCCTWKHLLERLMAFRPLGPEPRSVFHTPSIGSLSACMLQGEEAALLSSAFLKHAQKHSHLKSLGYDKQVSLPAEISKALLLKRSGGEIKMLPCKDGLLLYRNRSSTQTRTLIAIVNSEATHPDAVDADPYSPVQVHKLVYSDDAKKSNFRFTLVDKPTDIEGELSTDSTVQSLLSHIAHVHSLNDQRSVQCHGFTSQCEGEEEDSTSEEEEEEEPLVRSFQRLAASG